MKIGIFGGSFDPPHIGHKKIVKKALKKLDLDLLIVVPTFLNPLKNTSFLDARSRLDLLKTIFFKKKRVFISDYEINQNRAVYSLETIKYLKHKYKSSQVYLIIGADNYNSFDKWKDHEEIKELCTIVVASRNTYETKKDDDIKRLKVDIDISSSDIRGFLNLKYIPKKIRNKVKKIWQKKGLSIEKM